MVADLVLAGVSRDQVREFLAAPEEDGGLGYRPTAAQLTDLIDQAKADLAGQAAEYADIADDLTVVRLNDLYTRALKAADIKTALDVQKALARYIAANRPAAGGEAEPKTGAPAPAPAEAPAFDPEKPEPAPGPRAPGGYSDVMGRARGRRA